MTREKLAGILPRAALDTGAALEQIRPVCEDVRDRGAAAVREYTARFDGVDLPTSRVPAQVLADALATLSPELRAALEEMIRRVRPVHEAQRPAEHVTTIGDGARVTERYVAVDRAGVYVPAGLVPLPSSVIMNVVPAQVAGVGRIAVASPPGSRAPKFCRGWISTKRYFPASSDRPPPSKLCHDNGRGLPDAASASTSWKARIASR